MMVMMMMMIMIIMRDDDDSNGSDDDPFNYTSSSSPLYHYYHTLCCCCLVLKNAQFVNTVVDVHLNHFTCPLCKKIGNTIMPYTSHATSAAVATAVGDGDEGYQSKQCSDELSSSADDSEWLMMMMAADTTSKDDEAGIGSTDSDGVIMMAEWNR